MIALQYCIAMLNAQLSLSRLSPGLGWIWYDPVGAFGSKWDGMCFLRTTTAWGASPQHDTYSARCYTPPPPPPPPNVWRANLTSGGTPIQAAAFENAWMLTLLTSPDGGRATQRAFRARYPNANLETDLFPLGWSSGAMRNAPPLDNNTNVSHTALPGEMY